MYVPVEEALAVTSARPVRETCPACGAADYAPFADFGLVPVSGQLLGSPEERLVQRQLAFSYCRRCALIRQDSIGGQEADYTEVTRRTRRQLPAYAVGILGALRGYIGLDDLVIEVGANDGSFLDHLRGAGFQRRLGIEPSRALAALCGAAGHAVENRHLTLGEAPGIIARHGLARAVICRHTLEHVPDPLAFLRALRALLSDQGVLYLEVPATEPIVERLQGHELWDEHLSYFSPDNLGRLAARAGLATLQSAVLEHRASLNLALWARPVAAAVETRDEAPLDAELLANCASFAARWRDFAKRLHARAAHWRGPVIAMGASHPQSNFLLFSGLGSRIDVLVDDDEVKAGRYLALPRPTLIRSSGQVVAEADGGGTLLLSAFGYERWARELGAALVARGYDIVDPLAP